MFTVKVFNYGNAPESTTVTFEFKYEGDPEYIQYLDKTCSCTKAIYENGYVKGTLDLPAVQENSAYTQYVNVFYNDGQERYKGDPVTKKRIDNPEKKFDRLMITGVVTKAPLS